MAKVAVSFGTSAERRWQTFAVMLFVSLIPSTLLFWFFAFTLFWVPIVNLLLLGYLAWVFLVDKSPKTGSRTPLLRYLSFWKYFVNYFPIKLVKTADLPPVGRYVIGYHPHGIISMGAFGCFATDAAGFSTLFPSIDVRLLTLPINFKTPFLREVLLWMGMCDSSRETCETVLSRCGTAIVLVVGGAQEALLTHPGTSNLVLSKRQGFVREAIIRGASLVPTFAFGENDLYNTHSFPPGSFTRWLQEFAKRQFSFSLPIFHGRGIFLTNSPLYLPFRTPVTVVMGAPIPVPKVDPKMDFKSPEGKQIVDSVHQKYQTALSELFDAHKDKYGYAQSKLVFE